MFLNDKFFLFVICFKDVHKNIGQNKPAILETIVMGEQFLRENQDKLTSEQQEEMQKKIDDLRAYFDQVERKSNKTDKDTQNTIDRLERELEEEVRNCVKFL